MSGRNHGESHVEVMDTTLRDGEQTPGVSFSPGEKLEIARLLLDRLRVDRMEIASAGISEGDREAVRAVIDWAERREHLDAVEILGFIDNGKSVEWVKSVGGRVINLLAKGSERHCRVQLKRTPARHFDDVCREIELAANSGLKVNVYLEDWSNGMRENFSYVSGLVSRLAGLPVERIMLADTLGVLTPADVTRYFDWMYHLCGDVRFDFHGHNDYGLVTANSLAAVCAGADGIHASVNGLGERAGNQMLQQLVVAVNDLTDRRTRVAEKELQHATDLIQSLSGKRCAWNTPVVGADVYTQTCGVHADGDKKGGLYMNRLLPERFGRQRDYALGKLSGKASIDQNLDAVPGGEELDSDIREKVLREVVRLGDRKKTVTAADLPFIIAGVLHTPSRMRIQVMDFTSVSGRSAAPRVTLKLRVDDEIVETCSEGDGGYDAFVKALRKGLRKFGLKCPRLFDYEVRIPPGGRTDALVETTITWHLGAGKTLVTTGIDSDQLAAAVQATEKMLNTAVLPPEDPQEEHG
jgi:D-citramalate synthase